jgi:hypothetical protein
MHYRNTIYTALGFATSECSHDDKERKLAVAYVYALAKGRTNRVISKNPLASEGQNVYVAIDNIGRATLREHDDHYLTIAERALSNGNYEPVSGTVEEVVMNLIKQRGMDETLDALGSTLKSLVFSQPNFSSPSEKMTAGSIQRKEQDAIRAELAKKYDEYGTAPKA